MRQKMAIITQYLHLPVVCMLCHHYHSNLYAVCERCRALLTPLNHTCCICCLPLTDDKFRFCGICIKQRPYYDRVITIHHFCEPLRTLLHEFKYYNALYLRTFLVQLMLEAYPLIKAMIADLSSVCLVPVPMHRKRLQQRRFNQAAELAKLLSKHIAIPVELTLCQKKINTPTQVSLNSKERRRNLQQAFSANPTRYSHVILIDDLVTTGSTVNELAYVLKKKGVKRVDVWCLARAS
jgi:ComF family protein